MERDTSPSLGRSSRSGDWASYVSEYFKTNCAGGESPHVLREVVGIEFADCMTGIGSESRLFLGWTCKLIVRAEGMGKWFADSIWIGFEARSHVDRSAS